ncbi:MAG: hypothetical protein MRZ90_05900 [Candidatus Gastranaerophilales bacterium]|nr:hypothetical protein [Candidatus Gastranaerophilales bacterium]
MFVANEEFYMFASILRKFSKKERVTILTQKYEIVGWLYSSGFSHRRFLSDLLNGANKNFIAVTDCSIVHLERGGETEYYDFLQLNTRYIVLIKPAK